jgi:uncharacterized repeat protein (TIGR03803 family)
MTKLLVCFATVFLAVAAAQSSGQNFQSIFSFPANGTEGAAPEATLTVGPDGSLYGTASQGGATGAGTAFKISTAGAFTRLGNFEAPETGKAPVARMVNIGDGFLYGVTSEGTGTAGDPLGTVFKLDPAGGTTNAGGLTKVFALPGSGVTPMRPHALVSGEANTLHVLGNSPGGIWRVPLNGDSATNVFNFAVSGDEGLFPESIIPGADGNLYGVTQGNTFVGTTPGRRGTIFAIAPNGSGFSTVHDCDFDTGAAPIGAMVQDPDGIFYGTMSAGGTNSDGVIFRLEPSGGGFAYSVVHSINDNPPTGDLLLASDGRLYGTSRSGGANLFGSVFRINTNGTGFQVIHTFNKANGAYPAGGLVQALDGNLYGVTAEGGIDNKGTIYRIDLNLPTPEVNRRPFAVSDQAFSSGSAVGVSVLANDFDPDEDELTVTVETQPLHGTATVESTGAITYAPTPGGGYNGFDEFTYRITDPEGFFDVAAVTITDHAVPDPWQPGTYNGILNLDPALTLDGDIPRGQLVVTISETGVLTGRLFANGKRLAVRGAFDGETAIAIVKESKRKKALMFLAKGEGNSLIAVMFGQEQLSGFIFPLATPNPSGTGSFTTLLEPISPGLPEGYGFGAMRVLSNGLVVVVGRLGDGSKLAWGTTLVSYNGDVGIPVFSTPVKNGFVAGSFMDLGNTLFQGNLKWFRPEGTKPSQPYSEGFAGELGGLMDPYTRPAKGELAVDFGPDQAITILCPPLGPDATGTVTAQGTRLRLDGSLKSFSFSKATGLFKGKLRANNRTIGFQGAVTQSQKAGYGYYVIDKVTGAMGFDSDIE